MTANNTKVHLPVSKEKLRERVSIRKGNCHKMLLDTSDMSIRDILNACDDSKDPVVFSNALFSHDKSIYTEYLELGAEQRICVQQYHRQVKDGIYLVLEEDAGLPIKLSCQDYSRYMKLCDKPFKANTMNGKEKCVYFTIYDKEGEEKLSINIFDTILYAIDISLKNLSPELDLLFRQHFKLSDYFLPGNKYCFLQYVSNLITSLT